MSTVETETDKNINNITNQILCGDCLQIMRSLPDKSIDLAVTSPPYNLRNSSGNGMKDGRGGKWSNAELLNGYKNYQDSMNYEDYISWQRDCLNEMYRLLTDNGAIFYNHKWRVQNGLLQDRYDIVRDLPVRQIIIWKRNGGINFNPGYFLPTYEVIYLIAKRKFKLKYKANALGDVWEIPQDRGNKHPAPFPEALVDRIISSTDANLILDPFMGSGTTAISALKNKRNFIGIDLVQEYCDMANERINDFIAQQNLF